MEIRPTRLGCAELRQDVFIDSRGAFVKVFQRSVFSNYRLDLGVAEMFFSRSNRGVIRGMHFQAPPRHQTKLVTCVSGTVLDVIVDLRADGPTYGQTEAFELDASKGRALYIPEGFAHGFATLTEEAVMLYATSAEHDPAYDTGVRWDSIDFEWPFQQPAVSDRDRSFIALAEFQSPFHGR